MVLRFEKLCIVTPFHSSWVQVRAGAFCCRLSLLLYNATCRLYCLPSFGVPSTCTQLALPFTSMRSSPCRLPTLIHTLQQSICVLLSLWTFDEMFFLPCYLPLRPYLSQYPGLSYLTLLVFPIVENSKYIFFFFRISPLFGETFFIL